MSFYIYAWIAALASGLVVVLQKLTSKHSISNPLLLNFFFSLFVLVFIFMLALVNHTGLPHSGKNIFFAAFFGQLFWIFYILALYKLDVSVISPLFNFRSIFSILLGVVFLGEVLRLQQLLLMALIIFSGFFVAIDEKLKLSSFFKPAIALMMLAMFALALNGYFINIAALQNSFWEIALWQSLFSQLLLLFTIPLFIKDIPKTKFTQLAILFAIAFIQVFYELAANKSFSTNLAITSIIISLPVSMIIAFLFSTFAPKLLEKHTNKVYLIRIIAAGVMIFASLRL